MKVKPNNLYFISTILTLIACGQKTSKIQQNPNQQDSLAGQAIYEEKYVTDTDQNYIISYPDTLYLGDTLKMEFKTPHPKDFAITTPDKKFFFVIYAFNDTTKPSLYDWNEFANMRSIEIATDKTKANNWDARVTENQIIFNRTGVYEIRLSENLETDDGTPVETIKIYYVHEKR
jgi:hypothetical protein